MHSHKRIGGLRSNQLVNNLWTSASATKNNQSGCSAAPKLSTAPELSCLRLSASPPRNISNSFFFKPSSHTKAEVHVTRRCHCKAANVSLRSTKQVEQPRDPEMRHRTTTGPHDPKMLSPRYRAQKHLTEGGHQEAASRGRWRGDPGRDKCACLTPLALNFYLAVDQNQWYHFGVGAPPILVYFSGDWDVHWGYMILTHGHLD